MGRAAIPRGEAHRESRGIWWASRRGTPFDPPYETRRGSHEVVGLFRVGVDLLHGPGRGLRWAMSRTKPVPSAQLPKPLTICAVPASMPRTGKTPDGKPSGLDTAVAERVGRLPGPAGRVPLVRQRRVLLALPARGPLRRGRRPAARTPGRPARWPGACPMPAPSSGWWSHSGVPGIRSLADLRGKRVGIVAGTVAISEKDHAVVRFRVARGAARRVLAQQAGRRLPRRRLRRLVPARAPEARACGSSRSTCPASAGTWPWRSAPRMRSSWWRSTGPWPSSPSRASCGRSTPTTACRSVPRSRRRARQPKAAPDTWRRIRERGELVVSMDPANLPYSSAKDDRPGFDVELARALADRLHRQAPPRMAGHPSRDRRWAS